MGSVTCCVTEPITMPVSGPISKQQTTLAFYRNAVAWRSSVSLPLVATGWATARRGKAAAGSGRFPVIAVRSRQARPVAVDRCCSIFDGLRFDPRWRYRIATFPATLRHDAASRAEKSSVRGAGAGAASSRDEASPCRKGRGGISPVIPYNSRPREVIKGAGQRPQS